LKCPSDGKSPSVSGERAVHAFRKAGWINDRQRGSYVILVKGGHPASLSVPQHRQLAPGTLRSLIRAAGMTVDEFVGLI
jgi:predicted RNA binding protein YcfA (HicA-like mRNA interferase family)